MQAHWVLFGVWGISCLPSNPGHEETIKSQVLLEGPESLA